MERSYRDLQIKNFSDEGEFFVFTGVATTPNPDRMDDIVDPMGAKFAESIPLLWQHQHEKPIGKAKFGKPSKTGIPFSATIPVVKETGALKDRVDEAIQSIKYSLVTGVSIGFRVLNDAVERLATGGLHFKEYEVVELSVATIPANADAIIYAVKAIDQTHLPASGLKMARPIEKSPGVTGKKRKPILLHKR